MLNFVALKVKGFGEMLDMRPWLDQKYVDIGTDR